MNLDSQRGRVAARFVKALGACHGKAELVPSFVAGQRWLEERAILETVERAAVGGIGTGTMAVPTPAAFDFAEFVRPMTILGKLQGLRRVPSRVRSISATAGSGASWVGEGQPVPISRVTLAGETLEPLKVTAAIVATAELLRSGSPNAESILSRDLAAATVYAMDRAFIDPDNAGTADVEPAAVTNGVTPIASTGATLAAIDADLEDLIMALSDAGSTLEFAAFVMRPRTAVYLSKLRGTGGALAFPGMTARGGTLMGLPAITSTGVPVEVGSPGDGDASITLLDASQILVADEGGGDFEVTTEATLEMLDNPTNDASTPTATTQVSMFQTSSAAIKATRFANWRRCRDGMAQVLRLVAY